MATSLSISFISAIEDAEAAYEAARAAGDVEASEALGREFFDLVRWAALEVGAESASDLLAFKVPGELFRFSLAKWEDAFIEAYRAGCYR